MLILLQHCSILYGFSIFILIIWLVVLDYNAICLTSNELRYDKHWQRSEQALMMLTQEHKTHLKSTTISNAKVISVLTPGTHLLQKEEYNYEDIDPF